MPAADCSVGFAHGIDSLVFESGDIWRFFSWAEPTLRLGRRRLKSWGDRFQTTFLCFMVDEREPEISKQFPFKYKKFS